MFTHQWRLAGGPCWDDCIRQNVEGVIWPQFEAPKYSTPGVRSRERQSMNSLIWRVYLSGFKNWCEFDGMLPENRQPWVLYYTVCARKAVKYKPGGWYRSKARGPLWMCSEYHGRSQAAHAKVPFTPWSLTRTVGPLGHTPLSRAPTAGLRGF